MKNHWFPQIFIFVFPAFFCGKNTRIGWAAKERKDRKREDSGKAQSEWGPRLMENHWFPQIFIFVFLAFFCGKNTRIGLAAKERKDHNREDAG